MEEHCNPGEPERESLRRLRQPDGPARAWLALCGPPEAPAFGGVRRRTYSDPEAARADARALARAMAAKCALYGLEARGAKLVLDAWGDDPETTYRWLGREVEALGGALFTGPDLATGARELGWLAASTRYVVQPTESEAYARATALGVTGALAAALEHTTGRADFRGRAFVIQGLGQVGANVAAQLCAAGGHVRASESDGARAAALARRLPLELVPCGAELELECDALVPCAVGGFLTAERAERLPARILCGSANNLVAEPSAAERWRARGHTLVPDEVSSAGALLKGVAWHLEGRVLAEAAVVQRVRNVTARVLARASAEGLSPTHVARLEARGALESRGLGGARSPNERTVG